MEKRRLCAPDTVEGSRGAACNMQTENANCERQVIKRGGNGKGGGGGVLWGGGVLVSGLPNYSTHVRTIQTPAVLPPGNNMLFVHPGAFAFKACASARN